MSGNKENVPAVVDGAADILAALESAKADLVRTEAAIDKKLEALAIADQMIKRFEERQKADTKIPYCPVRDGKLIAVYTNKMVYDDLRRGMKGIMALEWVEQDHPCVKLDQQKIPYDKYTALADWKPLEPGEEVGDRVVKMAGELPTHSTNWADDFSESPKVATIKKVKIVDGKAVEVEIPLG